MDKPAVFEIVPGMSPAAVQQLCARLALAASEQRPVSGVAYGADLSVVNVLARVELLSRGFGQRWSVRSTEFEKLSDLLTLTGLDKILVVEESPAAGAEAPGEAESREQ